MKQITFKNVVGVVLRTQRRYKVVLDRQKNIVKPPSDYELQAKN